MIRANSRSGIPRSVGHIEKQMTYFIWAWEVRAQCCPGLTDPQESFMEGQIMRFYPGFDLIGKQSTPQLQLQPHGTAIYLLMRVSLSKLSPGEERYLMHLSTCCVLHMARWLSYFCSLTTNYILQVANFSLWGQIQGRIQGPRKKQEEIMTVSEGKIP